MIAGLLLLHITSYVYGAILMTSTQKTCGIRNNFLWIFLLIIINASTVSVSHTQKHSLFGFAFYYIPSISMAPSMLPGDVVLVDTWIYSQQPVLPNDIVIFTKHEHSATLVKRVKETRNGNDGRKEVYVLGDNTQHSVDSRDFGWIGYERISAKVTFRLLALQKGRNWLSRL